MGRYSDFSWDVDPRGLTVHIEDELKSRTLFLARRIFYGVVARTPVDTGNAKANWNVSEGSPDYHYVDYKVSGLRPPVPAFGLSRLSSPYTSIHITNATPYIDQLEFGWSKQAPAGMVRVTMASYGIG